MLDEVTVNFRGDPPDRLIDKDVNTSFWPLCEQSRGRQSSKELPSCQHILSSLFHLQREHCEKLDGGQEPACPPCPPVTHESRDLECQLDS